MSDQSRGQGLTRIQEEFLNHIKHLISPDAHQELEQIMRGERSHIYIASYEDERRIRHLAKSYRITLLG